MPPRKRKNTPAARSEDSTPNAKRSCGASRGAAATENSQPVLPASSDVQPAEQEYGVASLRRPRAEESSPSSRRNSQEGGNYGASRPGAAAQTRREDVTLEDDLEVPLPTREQAAAEKTTLEKLADFVYREAELAAATSIFDTDIPSTSYVRDSQIKKKPSRLRTAATYTTTHGLRRLEKGYTGPSDQTGRPKKPVITYALLDEGSTITLIERKLAREIGARGPRLNFALKGINDKEAVTVASEKVELEIQGAFDAYAIKHAISVPDLNLPLQTLSVEIVERVKFTENVNVQAYSNARPRLLLGQEQWQMIATREFRELKRYMLGISRSLLGWAVHGSMPAGLMESAFSGVNEMKSISSCEIQVKKEEERLDELVKQYFQLDNFGVSNTNKTKNEHTYAVQILRNTARKVDNAWEVGLLWRKEPAPQVDSLATARQRLFSLERKLDRDPEYASLYYQEMDRLIKNGYAERVDRDSTNERVWYLPHFGVRNTNKPGRVRLVFDAAAKSAGISLNYQLESGPDLLQSLPGVLIRFRQEVRKKDRGAQRFLWRGKSRAAEPDVYEMTSLIFGAKPSPCSAMFVKDENARSFAGRKPRSAASIINNSYMDDFLASRRTVQEAACLVRDVVNINANANFEMHGWVSNDERALLGMNVRDLSEISKNPLCIQKGERVLGLFWDTRFDMLGFNIGMVKIPESLVNKEKVPTKREYLRVVMSVFDPLGFLSRLTLMSKILMQEIWRSGFGWDDHIRMEEHAGWLSWVKRLREAVQIRVPRCVSPNGKCYTRADLHVFCDASLKAYAAVAYLRFEIENAPAHIALIMAKTRVAPLKPLSIPRLELQAAFLSASSAVMALQRLAARRGSPLAVYSDNGTNFVRASKELKDAIAGIDTEKQKEYAASKRIKWLFNPPDAPHMGGAWERMIRSVKTALDTVLRDQATSEEVLVTLLAEIEHSVNSRPLTHVSVDPRDNEALTPNHFLIGTSSGEIRLGAYEFRAICPRNQWRIAQSFADAFWKRWLKEYLPTLIPRTKWNRTARPLAVGDLVIIIDYQTPRNVWKRGTVIDVYPSVDGEVRIAKPNVRKQQQVLFVAVKPYTC
ncbi:uncharacterized protein LOC143363834 [Halictus rubicundus]|uniref:uncharacterized protein LOC143363834 n=1 Tax=Halictus rubicundus TaxID=77578 RepID=UPI0040375383